MIHKLLLSVCTLLFPLIAFADDVNRTEDTVQIQNGELYCLVLGSGDPIIVLHGGPGLSHDYLVDDIGRLADNHQIIFYDQRGCGKSTGDITDESITLQNYVDDIEAVRNHFGFNKVTLLGHGWGGLLAANYVVAHANVVDKLILIDPFPINSNDYKGFQKDVGKLLAPRQAELTAIRQSPEFVAGDPEAFTNYFQQYYSVFFENPIKVSKVNFGFTADNTLKGLKVAEIFTKNVFSQDWDLKKALRQIKTPTLVVCGDRDPVDKDNARKYSQALQKADFVLIKKCGHFPFIEQRNKLFDSFRDFFKH